jgi:hypothetical protein
MRFGSAHLLDGWMDTLLGYTLTRPVCDARVLTKNRSVKTSRGSEAEKTEHGQSRRSSGNKAEKTEHGQSRRSSGNGNKARG